MLRKLLIGTALALATLSVAPPAEARQGCGNGYHRFHGRCVSNHRRTVYVIGRYYPNRGYWDGRRWWRHHERDHRGHWRYR